MQHFVPHHLLSRLVGKLAHCQQPWLKNIFIDWFVQHYKVDMNDALESNPRAYPNFNGFFTRALKPDVRPIVADPKLIASPIDGAVSQVGKIQDGRIFQAKGFDYSLKELLGGSNELAQQFMNGQFATLYLSPRDYHRVHMPIDGELLTMIHVPGRLFSVNTRTTERVERLFARNERVISIFSTAIGPMAVILVGAMIVASISTVWHGEVTPPEQDRVVTWHYDHSSIFLPKGAEMGRFQLGSTAILLFPPDVMQWAESMKAGYNLTLGQAIGGVYEPFNRVGR